MVSQSACGEDGKDYAMSTRTCRMATLYNIVSVCLGTHWDLSMVWCISGWVTSCKGRPRQGRRQMRTVYDDRCHRQSSQHDWKEASRTDVSI